MKQPRLTDNEALDGMLRLFSLTENPVQTNKKKLSKESKLPVAKISILTQQGIIKCNPSSNGKRGRSFEWQWVGYRPNIHMAKKLAEATPDFPSQCSKVVEPTPKVEEGREPNSSVLRSKVVTHRTFEITKRLNNAYVELLVAKAGDGNVTLETEVITGTTSEDELRCWGVAFLTAADEVSKE